MSELHWAAGFFDGEGNCRWRPNKVYGNRSRAHGSFALQIGQVDRYVLDRFRDAVGVGKVYGPYQKKNGSSKSTTYYSYQAVGTTGIRAFEQIRSFLSPIKREQGDLAAEFFREQSERPKLGNGHLRKKELRGLNGIKAVEANEA